MPDTVNELLQPDTAATHAELQEIADTMGYDYADIQFADLPDHVGGYTTLAYDVDEDGYVVPHGDGIVLNDALRAADADDVDMDDHWFYDETGDELDTFYHELIHGKQFRDIWDSDDPYTEGELLALKFLHEGQAASNADQAAYRDAQHIYGEFLDHADETDPGTALETLSDEYYLELVQLEDGPYHLLAVDREQAGDIDAFYDRIEAAYGLPIDEENSHVIDYRDMDTAKLGDHLYELQDAIEDGYGAVADELDEDILPSAYHADLPQDV